MKVIILAAGQGTRLRPLTDNMPKCMVEVKGKSLVKRQLETMSACGIAPEDIFIVCGYKQEVLKAHLAGSGVNFIVNEEFASTNMVCSLMCAKEIMGEDAVVSYGDILYTPEVLNALLASDKPISVVIDDEWQSYWMKRGEDWFSDAETLKLDAARGIVEIGQKPKSLDDVQSQYIGLMRYRGEGISKVVGLCERAKTMSEAGQPLWGSPRDYSHMYMTDMLQALIAEDNMLSPVHIKRGWYEIDDPADLALVESQI